MRLVKCLDCGSSDQDWWDALGEDMDGDEIQVECGNCNRTYRATVHAEVHLELEGG